MKWLIFSLIVILLLIAASALYTLDCGDRARPAFAIYEKIDQGKAIEYLEDMKYSHQYFVDQPWRCNEYTGNVSFHRDHVKRYQQLIDFVKRK